MVVIRGRLEPEAGALLVQALAAAREALYQRRREGCRGAPPGRPRGRRPDDGPAAGRRVRSARRDRPSSRARSRRSRRPLPGRRPRRRRRRSPIPTSRVSPSSRTAPAFPRKRRAAWRATPPAWSCGTTRRPRGGDRGADADHPARVAARAPAPRPRVPVPGVREPLHAGPSHAPLGARRADDALESRAALSAASPGGARDGLSASSAGPTARSASATDRRAVARRATAPPGACGSRSPSYAQHAVARRPAHTQLAAPELARGAAGSGLGHRRAAPAGQPSTNYVSPVRLQRNIPVAIARRLPAEDAEEPPAWAHGQTGRRQASARESAGAMRSGANVWWWLGISRSASRRASRDRRARSAAAGRAEPRCRARSAAPARRDRGGSAASAMTAWPRAGGEAAGARRGA